MSLSAFLPQLYLVCQLATVIRYARLLLESNLCILTTEISVTLFAIRRCSKVCQHSYHTVSCLPWRLSGKVCYRIELLIIYSQEFS